MTTEDGSPNIKTNLDAIAAMSAAMNQQTMQAMTRAQEAVTEVLEACFHSAQSAGHLTPGPHAGKVEQLMKPSEMIDRGFDLAEQLLKAQHTLVRTLIGAVEQQGGEAAEVASPKTAIDTANAENDVADEAHAADLMAGTPADLPGGAAETDAPADDSDDSGGLGQTLKNVFRGNAEGPS